MFLYDHRSVRRSVVEEQLFALPLNRKSDVMNSTKLLQLAKSTLIYTLLSYVLATVCYADQATVTALYETPQVISEDDAADDPAIWINYAAPEQSLVFGTDKQSGVYSYKLNGEQIGYSELGRINNIDSRTLTPGDRATDTYSQTFIFASNRTLQTVDLWVLSDSTLAEAAASERFALPITRSVQAQSGINIYGICAGVDKDLGLIAFVTEDEGPRVELWQYRDESLRLLTTFNNGGESEGCVYDDENRTLLISEEEVGGVLRAYQVSDQLDFSSPIIVDSREGHIKGDPEGVAIYKTSDTDGYVLLSSQGDSKFNVYDRQSPYTYRGSFNIVDGAVIDGQLVDGTTITDGIAVANYPFNSDFPKGLFVAQDNDNIIEPAGKPRRQNFKLVSFADIIDALEL
jgi:3-phytase